MLEDESGRVKLVGVDRQKYTLVTGQSSLLPSFFCLNLDL